MVSRTRILNFLYRSGPAYQRSKQIKNFLTATVLWLLHNFWPGSESLSKRYGSGDTTSMWTQQFNNVRKAPYTEYCTIYKGPGFLAVVWFGASHTPSFSSSSVPRPHRLFKNSSSVSYCQYVWMYISLCVNLSIIVHISDYLPPFFMFTSITCPSSRRCPRNQARIFKHFKEPKNRFQGINSASLCSPELEFLKSLWRLGTEEE
jgi:hypothetical protein